MPRNLQTMPITAQDIKQYIQTEDDFGLEVRAYRACLDQAFDASHGGTYDDPVTGKARQYDLRASYRGKKEFKVQLAVECKNLKPNFPLVVSRIPRAVNESFHEIIFSRKTSGKVITSGGDITHMSKSLRISGSNEIYRMQDPVGKSTAQIGKSQSGDFVSGDSEVYEKWAQAVASAHDLIIASVSDCKLCGADHFFTITLPILVVADGTLWVADYDENGALKSDPKQVEECTHYLGKEYAIDSLPRQFTYTVSHLHILTFTGFQKMLKRFSENWPHMNWHFWFPNYSIKQALEEK
jgi:hypothetical protein